MRLLLHCTFILLIGALFTGCATSKSFSKKGAKLEEAGLMEEAAQMYYTSLQKNRTNIDAKIGMKSTGQVVLNKKLQEFVQLKSFDKKKEAVAAWEDAMKYHTAVSRLGVQLEVADFYKADYEALEASYIEELYDEGLALMDAGDYEKAEDRFNEIARLDPEHNEATDLADIAFCEPLYKAGKEAFELGNYRAAYDNFKQVIDRVPTYKEAADYSAEALDLGLFTVALLPFENSTLRNGLDSKVEAYALEALTGVNDPFLKVVDRNNMELILEEQKLGLSGVIDEESAVSVGELIGAQAILTGTVLSFDPNEGETESFQRDAYRQFKVKRLNRETNKYYFETKYEPATYREFQRENRVTVSFQYKVISLKTGEVLRSRIIERSLSDNASWAEYDGELRDLFPASANGVNTNRRARNSMQQMFSANRTPKSTDQLTNEVFQNVTAQMKGEVEQLIRELVK